MNEQGDTPGTPPVTPLTPPTGAPAAKADQIRYTKRVRRGLAVLYAIAADHCSLIVASIPMNAGTRADYALALRYIEQETADLFHAPGADEQDAD